MWWNAWSVRESAAGIAVPAARRFRKAVSLAGETDFSNAVGGSLPAGKGAPPIFGGRAEKAGPPAAFIAVMPGGFFLWIPARSWPRSGAHFFFYLGVCAGVLSSVAVVFARAGSWFRARFPGPFQFETRCVSDPAACCFAEKRCFQSGPGGVAAAPRVFPFQRRNALEQFQFEMLCISNHTACRFVEKA